jgi:hypothetical protein
VRGLGHLVRRDFLALWNMERPVQCTGMLYRARNPMGLTTRSKTYFPCAATKALPPCESPVPLLAG